MSLGEFLKSDPTGGSADGSAVPAEIVRMNWADEMEKLDDGEPCKNFK